MLFSLAPFLVYNSTSKSFVITKSSTVSPSNLAICKDEISLFFSTTFK